MATQRTRKVGSLLMREISDLIAREIKDPRIAGVTIVEVDATGDLRRAVVYYRLLTRDDESRKRAAAGLKSAAGILRRKIGERIRMKFTPELDFKYDPTEDNAERIEALLREVATEEGLRDDE